MQHSLKPFSRRNAVGLIFFGIASVFLLSRLVPVQSADQSSKRSIENKVPSHVPLEIKIKPAKLEKIKDPNNKKWFRDLEIDITSTSDKPIYFFVLYVEMRDVTSETGATMMFPIIYGRPELVDLSEKPLPKDLPLLRNQTYTYVVPEKKRTAWEDWLTRNSKNDAMVLEITFSNLNFGDGTGFTSSGAIPIPVKQTPEELARCLGKSPPLGDTWFKQPEIFSSLYAWNLKPAALVPANFFSRKQSISEDRPPPTFVAQAQAVTNGRT